MSRYSHLHICFEYPQFNVVNVIFQAIGNLMEGECSVEGFVVDYEKALWCAIQQVFIGATINGCVFHWGQAVWRHVQVCLTLIM